MKIVQEMNNYFEKEYQETKALLENKPYWVTSEKEVVHNAIQRCLGVSMFVQRLNVTYQKTLYEHYQEKISELLEKR